MIRAMIATSALAGGLLGTPATATAAVPVDMLTYNVCAAYSACQSDLSVTDWARVIKKRVEARGTDVVMLQELCFGQWAALRSALPEFRPVWKSTVHTPGCAKWDKNGDKRFGLGVFVKSPSVERLESDLTVPAGEEKRAVLCARGPINGRSSLVCTTHLAQYIKPDNGSSEALSKINAWAQGKPVILGGDFNAAPHYPALDPVYGGGFAEVDETDRNYFTPQCLAAGATSCRSGEPTIKTGKKFDGIFVTARDFHSVRGDAVEPGLSDHRLLEGTTYPE